MYRHKTFNSVEMGLSSLSSGGAFDHPEVRDGRMGTAREMQLLSAVRRKVVKDEVENLKSSMAHGPPLSTARRGNGDADLKRRPASAPRDRE